MYMRINSFSVGNHFFQLQRLKIRKITTNSYNTYLTYFKTLFLNNNLNMSLKTISFGLLLFALLTLSKAGFKVTVKCSKCIIKNCQNTQQGCFTVTDDKGFFHQSCGPCQIGQNFQTEITQCSVETFAQPCSSGYCFKYNPPKNYCADYANFQSCLSSNETLYTVCTACSNLTCSNCLRTFSSSPSSFSELCYPNSCSDFVNISYQLAQCPNLTQFYGQYCHCCINSANTSQINHFYCTSRKAPFNEYLLNQNARNREIQTAIEMIMMNLFQCTMMTPLIVFLMLLVIIF